MESGTQNTTANCWKTVYLWSSKTQTFTVFKTAWRSAADFSLKTTETSWPMYPECWRETVNQEFCPQQNQSSKMEKPRYCLLSKPERGCAWRCCSAGRAGGRSGRGTRTWRATGRQDGGQEGRQCTFTVVTSCLLSDLKDKGQNTNLNLIKFKENCATGLDSLKM